MTTTIPAGWKLVPIEPTIDMLADADETGNVLGPRARRIYAAMLNAAPAAPGASTAGNPQPARDWELTCHKCDGSGHVYVKRQVAERKTDTQEFKEECECCEGRGFVFAFQDIPGIEEYVKTCRPAPAAGDAQGLTLAQKYEDACIVANASAQDAARYRQLRKALTSYDTGWLDRIAAALEAMGLDPDEDKLPTPEQVDGAFDAAQRKGGA